MEIGEIVKDFLRKHPETPSRTIARWINSRYPKIEIEDVRSLIRYYRGKSGAEHRLKLDTQEFINQNYDLPLPSEYDSSDFRISENGVWILSDIQFPFHDTRAVISTLDWGRNRRDKHDDLKAILLNGDILDCYQLSTFSRDPRERNIQNEIDDCHDFIEVLKDEFQVPIYWKFGNHEERFERYLYQNANELAWLRKMNLEKYLELEKFQAKIIKDKRIIKIGHLHVIHGHEFRGGMISPVNPARTLFLRAKEPTLAGDKHMTSEHSGRTIGGKLITCWSIGCLCQLKPKYMPINEWNHGFAFVNNNGEMFRVLNLRIENGIVY